MIGPCAEDPLAFLGCYSYPNHVLPRFPELGTGVDVPTLLAAIRAEFPAATVTHAAGCPVREIDPSAIPAAVEVARDAAVAVVVVGDRAGLFGHGTSGEGCDAPDLSLPGSQAELLAAVLASGTPTIVVSVSGRPYAMGDFVGEAAAIVQAFMPGEEAGSAIAGVLSGRLAPSGRLPVQIPMHPFGQPSTYLAPLYGQPGMNMSSVEAPVLFPFGHGLTYTEFAYGNLQVGAHEVPTDGALHVSIEVRNTGARQGTEVVQLYFRDPVAQTARPIQMLLGHARVDLAPGAAATVAFDVHTDRFAYHGRNFERIVEPGSIILEVGPSVGAIASQVPIELTGPIRVVPFDRVLSHADPDLPLTLPNHRNHSVPLTPGGPCVHITHPHTC